MKFVVKLLLKAGVTLGVIFIAYQYFMPGMGGIQLPGFGSKSPQGLGELGNSVVEKDVTVYQWKDEHGVTHFGGTPPTGQGAYEKKEIKANTNVMQALKPRQDEDKEEQRPSIARVGSPYSPEGVKDILDSAKDVQKQLDERAQGQQKLLDNL